MIVWDSLSAYGLKDGAVLTPPMNPEEEERKSEHAIQDRLKESLEEKANNLKEVRVRQNLSDEGAREEMQKWYDVTGFRTQEIDLLLVRRIANNVHLDVIEVKYFPPAREGSDRPKGSFYRGISKAQALLLTGVDSVSLYHFFHSDIRPIDVNEYGEKVTKLSKPTWLDFPFDYRCYQLQNQPGFNPSSVNPTVGEKDEITEYMTDFENGITRNENPLLEKCDVEQARELIHTILGIPRK